MKAFRRLALFTTAATTALMLTAAVSAQSTSSSIRIRVLDPTGQPLPGVQVSILHTPTGRIITRSSNEAGVILARGLAVGGEYVVSLTNEGRRLSYGGFVQGDINLDLGETETVTLLANGDDPSATQSAGQLEEIEITAERILSALRVGPGRDFSQNDIQSIASVGRDFASTLAVDPSIVVDSSVPRGPAIGIAGQNFRFNTVTIDGVPQNDSFGLSFNASATQRSPISLDAIQAIQVNVAPFDVTYGNFLGGNINIVTRSGDNDFHGGGFFFYTDDGLTGDQIGNDEVALGNFDEVIWGGTLGGPIVEDKLFFFLNFEQFETTRPGNAQTLDQLGVDPAGLERFQQILETEYGFTDAGAFAADETDKDQKILVKLDWNITDRHRMAVAYQRADGDVLFDDFPNQPVLNSNRYNINESLDSYSAQLYSDWTDNFSTEIRVGFKDVKNRQVSVNANTPEFTVFEVNSNAGGDRFRQANELDTGNRLLRFKAEYLVGNHTLTAGIEQDHLDVRNTFLPFSRGQIFFNTLDDLENRVPNFLLFGGSNSGVREDAIAQFEMDTNTVYLQDEWAVTDTLTVKAGLRWDWINNNDPVPFNQNFQDRNGFANTENLDGKSLLAPRFGFNWDATDRLTVRGGAGLFGGGTPIIFLSNAYSGNGITRSFAEFFAPFFGGPFPAAFDAALADLPNPDAFSNQFQQFLGVNPNAEVDAIDPDFELLSSWKFNLGADYIADLTDLGLGDDWRITLDATLTEVQNGYDIFEGRRSVVGTAPDGRPIYDTQTNVFNDGDYIVRNTDQGSSFVLSANVDKTWDTDHGLFNIRAGYTYQDVKDVRSYGRFVGFETFVFEPQADLNTPDLSTSLFEIPHRVTAQFTYENDFWDDNTTRISFLWQGRSGRPASFVFSNGGISPFGGNALADGTQANSGTAGPNLFYVPTGLNDPLVSGDAAFLSELDAFIGSQPCLDEQRGQIAARNSCQSPWVNNLSMTFSQEIPVIEGHKIELLLNVENLGNLINSDWGRVDPWTLNTPSNVALADVAISDDGSQYIYSESTAITTNRQPALAQISSVYRIQFGVRYRF